MKGLKKAHIVTYCSPVPTKEFIIKQFVFTNVFSLKKYPYLTHTNR